MALKMSKNNILFCFCYFVVTVMLFTQGCKKKEEPQKTVPTVKAAGTTDIGNQPVKPLQKQISSTLKATPVASNQFDFTNKKDPFKPFVTTKKTPVASRTYSKRGSISSLPIHSFDVNQFRVIGIVSGVKENRAMVIDPNGKGYVIKVGMTIGRNGGRVMSITSGGVDVLEQFKDESGKTHKEHIRIDLPKKQ